MIIEEEFKKRVKEDKWFDNPDELMEYRLPVVQYWITKYCPLTITIVYDKEVDFPLINKAFISIKNKINLNNIHG